ncbi:MAG TPA: NUDIX domain-containing protein [Thermoanaerobaculia bacterium]|nr:NUDIX domain-containing protein [Thermoanaerobaculia bacterium]
MSMQEDVMVVETALLAPHLQQGIIRDTAEQILDIIDEHHTFLVRHIAEVSPQYRQIIPYVIIRCGDEWFVTRRTNKGTDARLHEKVALGVGGHIGAGLDLVDGMQKELDEEVAIEGDYDLTFAGILNDESTEVARVHLGIVYILDAPSHDVRVLETEKLIGEWHALRDLAERREAMESWSQIVYDELLSQSQSS